MPTKSKSKTAPRSAARKPEVETARQRFLRLGQGRMVNALHAIRLIGNLSAQGYEWTPDDIVLMKASIAEVVEEGFARFARSASAPKPEQTFKLTLVA